MATEFLLDAINQYVLPLLTFCGYSIQTSPGPDGMFISGSIVNYSNNRSNPLEFNNSKFNGQADVSPTIIPCIAFGDEHFLEIKDNPSLEIYNPFENKNHALALLLLMRPIMVPYCISKEKLDACDDESDYDKLANYISLYNSTAEDGQFIIGFTNTEDPEHVVDLFQYKSDDLFKTAWGLAVTVYKSISHDKSKAFQDIDKSWRKIRSACNKWDKARRYIKRAVKEEKLEDFDVNYIELSSETVNNMFDPREFSFDSDYILKDDSVAQNNYLNSLFYDTSFKPVTDNNTEIYDETEYSFVKENEVIPEFEEKKETVLNISDDDVSVTKEEPIKTNNESSSYDRFSPYSNQMMNPMMMGMGMPINPMMGGMGMMNNMNPMMGMGGYGNYNNTSYDMQQLDLTGGDIINPFAAYM